MREDRFRAFLTPLLSRAAIGSYLSNARAVERLLSVDLDQLDLSEPAVRILDGRLVAAGMAPARARDSRAALAQYRRFTGGLVGSAGHPPPPPEPDLRKRTAAVQDASTPDLIELYADVLDELRDRGVVRTGNGPIGDYAELLFSRAFGWSLAGNSAAGHDAQDPTGLRYQIKARRLGRRDASRQLGALRRLPERPFDGLAAVLFDERCAVHRAAIVPYDIVVRLAKRVEHTNSWRLMLSDSVWVLPDVRDVTGELRCAVAGL